MAILSQNELLTRRTVVGQVAFGQVAATHGTGIFVPAGAIVTNVRWMAPGAVTTTSATATVVINVGTVPLCATVAFSSLPAQTVCASTATAVASGVYLGAAGELNIVQQASAGAAVTCTYNVYVDYIYV